jgi:hypothetical protein
MQSYARRVTAIGAPSVVNGQREYALRFHKLRFN